jgi:hypothetical protein
MDATKLPPTRDADLGRANSAHSAFAFHFKDHISLKSTCILRRTKRQKNSFSRTFETVALPRGSRWVTTLSAFSRPRCTSTQKTTKTRRRWRWRVKRLPLRPPERARDNDTPARARDSGLADFSNLRRQPFRSNSTSDTPSQATTLGRSIPSSPTPNRDPKDKDRVECSQCEKNYPTDWIIHYMLS